MGLVSIIVPIYNAEQYFNRCIDSIRAQSHKDIEIILVDDGSPDTCGQLCDMAASQDERIKVIHKSNSGQGIARNAGLDIAEGEYVTFVDSDDWISEDHIAAMYSAIKKTSADIVIAAHSVASCTDDVVPFRLRIKEGVYDAESVRGEILPSVIGPDLNFPQDVVIESAVWGKLYRRSIIEENNIRFPSERVVVGEDMFFNALFLNASSRAAVINDTGYRYFENASSTTRKYNPLRYERTVNFYKQGQKLVKACGLEDVISFRLDRTFLLKVRTALRLAALSDMSLKEKRQEIARFLNDGTVVAVLENYPIDTYAFAIRLFAKFMRSKNVSGVYYLIRIRHAAKSFSILKRIAKAFGIGR